MRGPNPIPIGEQAKQQLEYRLASYFRWLQSGLELYTLDGPGPLSHGVLVGLLRRELTRLRMPWIETAIMRREGRRYGNIGVPDTKPMRPFIAMAKLLEKPNECQVVSANSRVDIYCTPEPFEALATHLLQLPAVVTMIQRGQELYPPSLLPTKKAG